MLQTQPSIIIVFGEMASGKSTVAKELAYQYFHLPEDAFFELSWARWCGPRASKP